MRLPLIVLVAAAIALSVTAEARPYGATGCSPLGCYAEYLPLVKFRAMRLDLRDHTNEIRVRKGYRALHFHHEARDIPMERRVRVILHWRELLQRARDLEALTPREIGKRMAARRGWTGQAWSDTDYIVSRESAWDRCAHYPRVHNDCGYGPFYSDGGSACGIPQAVPCTKLIGHGRELGAMSLRDQIRWTYNYIRGRYGSPAEAKAHWLAYQWY